MTGQQTLKRIRAAFERESRVHVHRNHIHMDLRNDKLVIEGEVNEIAAKKLALELAGDYTVNDIEDRLRLVPAMPMGDGALRDEVVKALSAEPALRNCAIRARHKGREETIRDTQPESGGDIHVLVEDGAVTLEGEVLSLSHQRLAGVLAWWAPGCRDVANRLAVCPPEEDSDEEINEAVRLVLERDHNLPSTQIGVTTKDRVVRLEGLVFRDTERKQAETDAWYVNRVRNVVNKIEVRH
ncbi:MAG: BON domain-containing protein [Sulfuricella sp.]|nr:BON domain-containing protein [Sulfuricella sp.]